MFTRGAAVASLLACASANPTSEVETAFEQFIAKFERVYKTAEEKAHRFRIFESNFKFIQAENAKKSTYKLAVNEFADQSPDDFKADHFGMAVPSSSSLGAMWGESLGVDLYSGATLPDSVDWVAKGAVTNVKNQGSCGSCWSFSTTGALEGAWQISSGKLVALSEQQLIDCDTDGNHGCQGGAMDPAFDYVAKHGLCSEESYKYATKQHKTCQENNCTKVIQPGQVTGHFDVPTDNTEALMEAVAKQPVSVGIEADQQAFQLYSGGVLTKDCGNKLDHGVLIVGYGTDNGVDYWKVKNSWGSTWGENGYVRIERGVKGDGECGVKAMASYPVLKTAAVTGATVVV